jgi:hypothetical protein
MSFRIVTVAAVNVAAVNMATVAAIALLTACSSATPEPAAPGADSTEPTASVNASRKPDAERLVKHLEEHVSYPASRADVLASCAQTPEFTEGEKEWTAEHLPDGNYENAEATIQALGI